MILNPLTVLKNVGSADLCHWLPVSRQSARQPSWLPVSRHPSKKKFRLRRAGVSVIPSKKKSACGGHIGVSEIPSIFSACGGKIDRRQRFPVYSDL